MLELYSDYLLAQNYQATATGLSKLLDHEISHDQVTRFLSRNHFNSQDLWKYIKPYIVTKEQDNQGVLILDDTIEHKPHTKENEVVCWHFDHTKQRVVKGINILTCMFDNKKISMPVAYNVITKTVHYEDAKTGKQKRKAQETKNEKFRKLIQQAHKNKVPFQHILADSWYCSKENMNFINQLGKKFIFAIQSNRLICLQDQKGIQKGDYLQLKKVNLEADRPYSVRVKGIENRLTLLKKVFKNGDGSVGTLYLISNDLALDGKAIYQLYQRRWSIETYHRSIKQNASLTKSPCWKELTQTNHIFLVLIAFCKLEILKIKTNMNHYALRNKLLLRANLAALTELKKLQKIAS